VSGRQYVALAYLRRRGQDGAAPSITGSSTTGAWAVSILTFPGGEDGIRRALLADLAKAAPDLLPGLICRLVAAHLDTCPADQARGSGRSVDEPTRRCPRARHPGRSSGQQAERLWKSPAIGLRALFRCERGACYAPWLNQATAGWWRAGGRPEAGQCSAAAYGATWGYQALAACRVPGCRFSRHREQLCCRHPAAWRKAGQPAISGWLAAAAADHPVGGVGAE
jgi:hypothetical protein